MNKTGFWYRLVHLDPALFRGLVVAVVALLASVGIAVTPALPDALIAVIAIVFAIVQALWTKSGVVPNEKVLAYVPDPVNAPDEIAAGSALTGANNDVIIEASRATPLDTFAGGEF